MDHPQEELEHNSIDNQEKVDHEDSEEKTLENS